MDNTTIIAKVNEWLNKHEDEFTLIIKNSNKIKINWDQEIKKIINLKNELKPSSQIENYPIL